MAESKGPETGNALSLKWVFGYNKDMIGGVHSLSDGGRDALFYCAGNTGVILNYRARRQQLLQGHCNAITCCCVSADKRWIVTADAGEDSMIVVWDALSGTPIKTIFNPHPNGVVAMDLSADAMLLATLSKPTAGGEQAFAVWEWTQERDGPLYTSVVPTFDTHTCVKFNPSDSQEALSNGRDRVVFWSWHEAKIKFFAPPIAQKDFRQPVGRFTVSSFLPGTGQAVTGTDDGDVLVWDKATSLDTGAVKSDRRAIKLVRLSNGGVLYMGLVEKFLVIAGTDGAVRFFDFPLRLVAWFEDMQAGPVVSVSFAVSSSAIVDPESFSVPDFIVGTNKALIIGMQAAAFEALSADQRRGVLLMQGIEGDITHMTAHPFGPEFAVATSAGSVYLWDTDDKQMLLVRDFDSAKQVPQSLAYNVRAQVLAAGFSDGTVRILDSRELTDMQAPLQQSVGGITEIRFSSDNTYMATADLDRCVAVYRFMKSQTRRSGYQDEDDEAAAERAAAAEVEQWTFLGKARMHAAAITALEFTMSPSGTPVLVSVGEDRRLVEYDLMNCSVARGVVTKGNPTLVEQTASPTSAAWLPVSAHSREQLIAVASDEYKFKLWNASGKTCRRTVICPSYGGPVNRMVLLPNPSRASDVGDASDAADESLPRAMVYGTQEKVIGIVLLPLDSNPDASMGLIAHASNIAGLAVSPDGRFVLSAGAQDQCVNVWAVNTVGLESIVAAGRKGDGMDPYFKLLDGGRNGSIHEEIADFFYYAQLRNQGENTTAPRAAGARVALKELPNLMRALGYYPTELEIEHMTNEIRYSTFTETGATVEDVSLNELIRLYLNHRPVLGVGKAQIAEAVDILSRYVTGAGGSLPWDSLQQLLTSRGEPMSEAELEKCLQALLGDQMLPAGITADSLAHRVLGFEDLGASGAPDAEF